MPTEIAVATSGIYPELKRRILDLRMAPGTDFTEPQLVADLGYSKTPIREALARLRSEGLVEAIARSGYRVTPVTLRDVRDLMALRALLEGEASALAAANGGDAEGLHALEELCRRSYDPADRASIADFLSANHDLHLAVARLSGNARLVEALAHVLEQLQRVMHLGLSLSSRAEEIVHEHQELLEAIVAGDPEAARAVAVGQARSSEQMVMEALLSSDAVQSTNLGVSSAR